MALPDLKSAVHIPRDFSSQLFHWDKLIGGNTIYRYPQLAAFVIVFKSCGHVPSQATLASANLGKNFTSHSTGSSVRNRSYWSDHCKQSCYLRKSSWLHWEATVVAFILQYLLLWVYFRAVHSNTPPWLFSAKNGTSFRHFFLSRGVSKWHHGPSFDEFGSRSHLITFGAVFSTRSW